MSEQSVLKRFWRHAITSDHVTRRHFPLNCLDNIEQAIRDCESVHGGEICFAVENRLNLITVIKGYSARQRALDVFSLLKVWDTKNNNGVLIYLLLADKDVEIIADRGINEKVKQSEWQRICKKMEQHFAKGEFEEGVMHGINAISKLLNTHFPNRDQDELSNKPVIL